VRFLLDAHVSGPRIGNRLQKHGHDVRALDQEPALEGIDDEEVLTLASEQKRILVTHNIRDFPDILREWASAQRSHAGAILVYGIDHREFNLIARGIENCLELYPNPDHWIDLAVVINRDSGAA
jgi:predicted nuclease of predicted toxin-antitoxin system